MRHVWTNYFMNGMKVVAGIGAETGLDRKFDINKLLSVCGRLKITATLRANVGRTLLSAAVGVDLPTRARSKPNSEAKAADRSVRTT